MLWLSSSFNYTSSALSVAVRVVVNQVLMSPIFNTYFFGCQALLSGDGWAGAVQRVVDTVPTSFVNSCKFWPAVNGFSFVFVPMQHRALFANVVSIGWQTYMSFLNRQAEDNRKVVDALEAVAVVVPAQQKQAVTAA
jgi:hypothetical protein